MSAAMVWFKHRKTWLALIGLTVLNAAIFLTIPQVDLAVSGYFFTPPNSFPLAESPVLIVLRNFYKLIFTLTFLLALAMLIASFFPDRPTKIARQIWLFILSAYVLGPGVLVNLILKNNWGRARPASIEAFGGEALFTPPLVACRPMCPQLFFCFRRNQHNGHSVYSDSHPFLALGNAAHSTRNGHCRHRLNQLRLVCAHRHGPAFPERHDFLNTFLRDDYSSTLSNTQYHQISAKFFSPNTCIRCKTVNIQTVLKLNRILALAAVQNKWLYFLANISVLQIWSAQREDTYD